MRLILAHLVMALHIVHHIREALIHRSHRLGTLVTIERRHIHTCRPFARSSLTVRVAIGHHHDHRLCLACSYQVVENLGGTSQGSPSILITTCAMKQVEHWVILSLVVTCWGIDGHTTLHLERRTVIPNLLHIAMRHLIDGVEVTTVAFLV